MSAHETLRLAVAQMREPHVAQDPFVNAVADWLDEVSADPFSTLIPEHRHALGVALAYLGESA